MSKPSNKPNSRSGLIQWRLRKMMELAKILNEKWNASCEAAKDRYIRIRGESCRAVSLNDSSPLCGFGDTGSDDVSKVIRYFDDADRQPQKLAEKDWGIKKERRLQSWIIKQALMNGRDLLKSPIFECLKGRFDELVFALDEVSFGDKYHEPTVRCDLLAVGVKDGNAFPVVIELKTRRDLGRLIEQLKNAEGEISAHEQEMRTLMELITGKIILGSTVKKVLVWPDGIESKATATKRKDSDVFFVQYSPCEFEHPNSLTATLPGGW